MVDLENVGDRALAQAGHLPEANVRRKPPADYNTGCTAGNRRESALLCRNRPGDHFRSEGQRRPA